MESRMGILQALFVSCNNASQADGQKRNIDPVNRNDGLGHNLRGKFLHPTLKGLVLDLLFMDNPGRTTQDMEICKPKGKTILGTGYGIKANFTNKNLKGVFSERVLH